jgi:hypothetical protein
MRWLFSLTLCVLGSVALADENTKVKATPEDFLGKWSGKWDNTYQVRFTITQDPKTKELKALYEWEENPGKPLRRQRVTAVKIEGNALEVGKAMQITISSKDPDKGKAVGNFGTKRRTADLVREKEQNR